MDILDPLQKCVPNRVVLMLSVCADFRCFCVRSVLMSPMFTFVVFMQIFDNKCNFLVHLCLKLRICLKQIFPFLNDLRLQVQLYGC